MRLLAVATVARFISYYKMAAKVPCATVFWKERFERKVGKIVKVN